ncbi:MAG: hypothetical protein LBM06_06655 [Prevotellaceae bacterium]|nr:hypothetical protein [Prevotellaceae bacterium]
MQQKKTEYIPIRAALLTALSHWKTYVLSVLICAVLAVGYYKLSSPVFLITSNVLIQEEESGMSGLQGMMMRNIPFGNLLGGAGTGIYDELQLIASYSVYRQVAQELGLNETYRLSRFPKSIDCYHSSPVVVEPVNNIADTLSVLLVFKIEVDEAGRISGKAKLGFKTLGRVEQPAVGRAELKTIYGTFLLRTTEYYQAGKSISVKATYSGYGYTAERLQKEIEADLVNKKANIVSLTLKEKNIVRGKEVLTTTIDVYNRRNNKRKNKRTGNILSFIELRKNRIAAELDEVEADIARYKKSNGISDAEAEAKFIFTNLGEFKEKVIVAESQSMMLDVMENFLKDPQNNYTLVPLNIGIDEKSVLEGLSKYNDALLQRAQLLQTTGAQNPTFILLTEQIDTMRGNLLTTIRSVKVGLSYVRDSFVQQEQKLDKRIQNMPTQERDFIKLKRQQLIKQELYLFLLQKEEENSLSMTLDIPKAQVVDAAYSLSKPVSLGLFKLLVLAFVLGLGIASVIVWKYGTKKDVSPELH